MFHFSTNPNNPNNPNGGGTGSITVTIDNLTIALLVASILYSVLLILAKRKLQGMHRMDPSLTPKKLLVMSVAVVCAVRIMTILGVAGMNIANVRAHYSLQPIGKRTHNHDTSSSSEIDDEFQAFYDRAMTVLFDLPNCVVVSTYVLLTLVWAECFCASRYTPSNFNASNSSNQQQQQQQQHQPRIGKRMWWNIYTIFNACLYGCQLLLYSFVFIATDSIIRTILYAAITCINFVAVCLVILLYLYVSISYSGYPPRSVHVQSSLRKMTRVMQWWSMTRVVWGLATAAVYYFNIELLQDSNTPLWSFVVLVLLLFGCEILPMIALLDYSYMTMMMFGLYYTTDNDNNNNGIVEALEQDSFFLTLPLLVDHPQHDTTTTTTVDHDNGQEETTTAAAAAAVTQSS